MTRAARDLVASEGTSVSVQAIADYADVALTTLYNHFDSKDELLQAAAIRALFDFEADVDRRMAGISDPAELVCVRTRLYLRMAKTHPQTAQFLTRLAPEILATPAFYSAEAESDVRAAVAAGKLKDGDIGLIHLVVNSAATAFTAMWIANPSMREERADALARELMLFLGMSSRLAARLTEKALPSQV